NVANAPSRKNEVGSPVNVAGILNIKAPVAHSVSNSTATTGTIVADATASTIATRSTSRTNGQTRNETSASWKIGIRTSTSASGGKNRPAFRNVPVPCRRCSQAGKTEWTTAKIK